MAQPRISEKDFIALFEKYGATETARRIGVKERAVYERRRNLELKYKRQINPPNRNHPRKTRHGVQHEHRIELDISNGVVLVASDAHYWPHEVTTAHRAFVKFCKDLKPKAVIMNGDVLDCASVSRHPPIGWEHQPSLVEEIETTKERLADIEGAIDGNCKRVWTLGNHDGRFETRLATVAPEYAKVNGVHLKDHFPLWWPAWSCWINGHTVVKHRFKGGVHATYNNPLHAGKTMVTGHLHSLNIRRHSDYNGYRWGVDTGTLAEPYGPQFVDYTEDSPKNWASGFVVLTFERGELRWPEVVHVVEDGLVEFRGETIAV